MDDLLKLDVCVQRDRFLAELRAGALDHASGPVSAASLAEAGMGKEQVMAVIEAGMASMQSYARCCVWGVGGGGARLLSAVCLRCVVCGMRRAAEWFCVVAILLMH